MFVIQDVSGEDLHEFLENYGIEFDDTDMIETFNDKKGGIMKELKEFELTVYDTENQTACIFLLDDVAYYEFDKKGMVKDYKDFISEKEDHPELVRLFDERVSAVIDPEVWVVELPALMIEDIEEFMPAKDGGQERLRVLSYVFKKGYRSGDFVRFNVRAVHSLCNTLIDMDHLIDSLKPTASVNVLMTLFEKAGKVVAIRVTKLRGGARAEIKGAYACSKGYGTLIQAWTENLIRLQDANIFPSLSATKRPVTFKLAALPTAVGFWKHVGFEETRRVDKEKNIILEKRILPSDEVSAVTATSKRKHRSPGEVSSRQVKRR